MSQEVRLERLHPAEVRAAMATAPTSLPLVLVTDPAPVSRYLTWLQVRLDGKTIDGEAAELLNRTLGEAGTPMPAGMLGPESGLYVRREQTAEVRLPIAVDAGTHGLAVELGLAGVSTATLAAAVPFA